jgi:hypothetical protein
MSFQSSAGWRTVIVEHWPDEYEFARRKMPGKVSVLSRLAPWQPDPTQTQLDELASVYARCGGVAKCRVVAQWWTAYPMLTPAQQRAAAGLP